MNPLDSPVMSAAVGAGTILAAALMAAPGHRPVVERRETAVAAALECRVQKRLDLGSLLQLTHAGVAPLQSGSRFVWVETGTPAAQGAVGVLPRALAGGESITLPTTITVSGAGCAAVLLD